MNARFLHIYLSPKPGVTAEMVEKKINQAVDWIHYDDNVWIVYSTADLSTWKTRLQPLAEKGGHYFICEIDPNVRVGWMAKSFWDWLTMDRS